MEPGANETGRLKRITCACNYLILKKLVGERGFEPPTPWSRTRCSTRLSHSPTAQRTATNGALHAHTSTSRQAPIITLRHSTALSHSPDYLSRYTEDARQPALSGRRNLSRE